MATPRYKLVDEQSACDYHLVCRCVRRSWLCGWDTLTLRDYSHRRRWLIRRIKQLAQSFGVEVYAYAVMSNHYHLVLHYDPRAREGWSNEEVARRWLAVYPPRVPPEQVEERTSELCELWATDEERIRRLRTTLGCLSRFMQHLNQPIARQANIEDGCEGHFFQHRFYSGALLSTEAMLAAMAYVDLNPVRAKIADRLEQCRDTSIGERLRENSAAALEDYLRPIASGIASWLPSQPQEPAEGSTTSCPESSHTRVWVPRPVVDQTSTEPGAGSVVKPGADTQVHAWPLATPTQPPPSDATSRAPAASATETPESSRPENESSHDSSEARPHSQRAARRPPALVPKRGRARTDLGTLASYAALLVRMAAAEAGDQTRIPDKTAAWLAKITALGKRQRAYGARAELRRWAKSNGLAPREAPLPA